METSLFIESQVGNSLKCCCLNNKWDVWAAADSKWVTSMDLVMYHSGVWRWVSYFKMLQIGTEIEPESCRCTRIFARIFIKFYETYIFLKFHSMSWFLKKRNSCQADQLAAGFMALNLNRGDRVGMWGPNSYEWIVVQWAAARAGLVLVSWSTALRSDS